MQRKPAGYILLSFLSFVIFTAVFHTVANVQSDFQSKTQAFAETKPVTPSPTVVPTQPILFIMKPIALPSPTPTATPIPRPTITTSADLEVLFAKYATEFNVNKEDLKRIAKCESGFNPEAKNGPYAGMYQFASATWTSNRNAMGLDSNPELRNNAEESIRTAAFMINRGNRGAWPNC